MRRKGESLGVYLYPEDLERLARLRKDTGFNNAEIVRRALKLLADPPPAVLVVTPPPTPAPAKKTPTTVNSKPWSTARKLSRALHPTFFPTREDYLEQARQSEQVGRKLPPWAFYYDDLRALGLADSDDGETVTFKVTSEDRVVFPELTKKDEVRLTFDTFGSVKGEA